MIVSRGALIAVPALLLACSCSESHPSPSDAGSDTAHGACKNALAFRPSNIDPDVSSTAFGDISLQGADCTIDSEIGTISCLQDSSKLTFALLTQPSASKIAVFTACSFRVESTTVLRVTGNNPVALVGLDGIDILGTVTAAPNSLGEAVGGGYQPPASGKGLGPGGGGGSTSTSSPGGAGYCGVGGAGGASSGTPQAGGVAYGNAELVPLLGGSSGGAGSGGGPGGGALHLISGSRVTIAPTGVVHVGGGGANAESGAGSGGAILIEAPSVDMGGVLAANGGSGGGGWTDYGANATPDATPAPGGGQGTDSPGGNGGAGTMINGSNGVYGTTNGRAAGGGGAVGRIRINSEAGRAKITGTISPATSTPCSTSGTLKPR